MANINFQLLIYDLSEDSFSAARTHLKPYTKYYYTDGASASKEMLLEKIGNYLEHFEEKNKCYDDEFASMYTSLLTRYVDNRVKENTCDQRTLQYYLKLKEINKSLPAAKENDLLSLLEDFTKIFLCLYDSYVMSGEKKKISNINFHVDSIHFNRIIEYFIDDSPEIVLLEEKVNNRFGKGVLRAVDGIHLRGRDLAGNVQDTARDIAERIPRREEDYSGYPVRRILASYEDGEMLTDKAFVIMVLILLYYRLLDMENIIE